MSIKKWLFKNLSIFYKVTQPPAGTDKQGVYLIRGNRRIGLYIVLVWNSRKTIYKIFDSKDFFTKETIEENPNDKTTTQLSTENEQTKN